MNDVASPCTDVCRVHVGSGWCEGCLRTLDEISAWSASSDDDKRALLADLPGRRAVWLRLHATPPVDGL